MKTSWNRVANWYNAHLDKESGNYHKSIIIPNLLNIFEKLFGAHKARILDLACGQGLVAAGLADKGYKVNGIDISPKLINIAKSKYPKVSFKVADVSRLSESVINGNKRADLVLINLAIQNIEDLDGVFLGVSKILINKGYLVIVMNHPYFRVPKVTSWGFDESKKLQYRRIDRYFSEIKIPIEMHPGNMANKGEENITWSFHRPLQTYVEKLHKYNFVLTDIQEWLSDKHSQPGARAQAENSARLEFPLFMCLICRMEAPVGV
jgi:SAM-dependent methyltransferase